MLGDGELAQEIFHETRNGKRTITEQNDGNVAELGDSLSSPLRKADEIWKYSKESCRTRYSSLITP